MTPGTGKSKSKKMKDADKENFHKGGDGAAEGVQMIDKDHEKEIEHIQSSLILHYMQLYNEGHGLIKEECFNVVTVFSAGADLYQT